MSKLLTAMLPMHAALLAAAEQAVGARTSQSAATPEPLPAPASPPLTIDREATLKYELTRIHAQLQDLRERTADLPALHRQILAAEYEVAEALNANL